MMYINDGYPEVYLKIKKDDEGWFFSVMISFFSLSMFQNALLYMSYQLLMVNGLELSRTISFAMVL